MIAYSVKRSMRAKHMRLTIENDGSVVVTIPKRGTLKMAELFVKQKSAWIKHASQKQQSQLQSAPYAGTQEEYIQYKEHVRRLIKHKLTEINDHYGLNYKTVSIRNQSSRWGSCSAQRNLSFNYRLYFLPDELVDYVITHEVCHLKEMNHSPRFWKLVSETIHNPKQLAKRLHGYPLK